MRDVVSPCSYLEVAAQDGFSARSRTCALHFSSWSFSTSRSTNQEQNGGTTVRSVPFNSLSITTQLIMTTSARFRARLNIAGDGWRDGMLPHWCRRRSPV